MLNKIPIVFAINNNYIKQLATVIISILKNSSKNNQYEFNILSTDLSSKNKEKLLSLKYLNKNTIFNYIDMNETIKNFDLEKYMSRRDDYKYISIETYFRFFIPELFPQYEKILYLDADMLVLQDLEDLYNTDIKDYYLGAIQDTVLEVFFLYENIRTRTKPKRIYKDYFTEKLRKKRTDYFNAGVLLLNLDKIRQDNMVTKLWEYAAKESPLEFQDQDVLNSVFDGYVKYLDYKWNTLKDLNWFATQIKDKKKQRYLFQTYKQPGIFHYVGGNKPWIIHNENYNYAFIEEWWKYYKLTPFFDKSDLFILKNAKIMKIIGKWQHYVTIKLLGFTIIDIYQEPLILKFKILNFLKTHIRFKPLKNKNNITSV